MSQTLMSPTTKDDARYECAAYKVMLPAQIIVSDVYAGTLRLRLRGQDYLPKFPLEMPDSYNTRLTHATLYNFYKKTVEAMCGMVFRQPPQLADDVPQQIVDLWEDIDGQGTHGDIFAKELLKKQFDGHVFIVTEYPEADPNIQTLDDELAASRRPYLVAYHANQAINWDTMTIGGRVVPMQVTFKETTTERTGQFTQKEVVRYRTWRLDIVDGNYRAVWELQREQKTGSGEIILVMEKEGQTQLSRIPVAVAYGEKTGYWTSAPPLIDLALKNVEHYQDYSDYRKGKSIAGIAIPWVRNLKDGADGNKQPIGWDTLIEVDNEGEVGFAEAGGNALGAQREALEDTKADMASLGLAMLVKGNVEVTATQRVIDNAQESSQLTTIARSLQDALEESFDYIAEYLGIDEGGSINFQLDDGRLSLDPQIATMLLTAVDTGKLSLETFLTILQQGRLLPEDFDLKAELNRIHSVDVIPTVQQ
jgi:hypothetical protein